MRKMSAINITSLAVKIGLIFSFARFGLEGFLLSAIVSQSFRVASAYYMMAKGKKENLRAEK